AAAAIPMPTLRFSAGSARPTTPSSTENEVPDRPMPISRPALSDNDKAESAPAIRARPAAYSRPPATITRRAPKRSATAPVNGCASPQIRFCRAMAKANTSRPQSNSLLIGARNRPKPCRTPSDSARISDAPSRIQPAERHGLFMSVSAGLPVMDQSMPARLPQPPRRMGSRYIPCAPCPTATVVWQGSSTAAAPASGQQGQSQQHRTFGHFHQRTGGIAGDTAQAADKGPAQHPKAGQRSRQRQQAAPAQQQHGQAVQKQHLRQAL